MPQDPLGELEAALGYTFRDRDFLSHALTHSSRKTDLQISNERLEFLGDAILGMVVSDHLYQTYVDYTEGDLTRVKSRVVSRSTLANVAKQLNLAPHLIVAKGVALSGGTPHPDSDKGHQSKGKTGRHELPLSLISNALEAIIAAVYLDGGIEPARELVLRLLKREIEEAAKTAHVQNYKSALQQIIQRQMGCTPVYDVIAEEGPDHVKWFEVVTLINGKQYGTGRGKTKKDAEQIAAEQTIEMLDSEEDVGEKADSA